MADTKISIIEVFLRYLTRTHPLLLVFHLFWILSACSILSISYVMAFHFTSLVHIYEEANHVNNFSKNLKTNVKVDAKINAVLNKLLTDTNSNRTYLFRYHNGLAAVNGVPFFFQTNTHEVISPGTQRLLRFYERIPASLTPAMNQKFAQNECVMMNKIDKADDIQVLYFYQSRNTKAMVRCPIFMNNGDLFGFIGIDYVNDQSLDKLKESKTLVMSAASEIANIYTSEKK